MTDESRLVYTISTSLFTLGAVTWGLHRIMRQKDEIFEALEASKQRVENIARKPVFNDFYNP